MHIQKENMESENMKNIHPISTHIRTQYINIY